MNPPPDWTRKNGSASAIFLWISPRNRTVLFSTHVVEDLAATCSELAVMKKGTFLYSGTVQELVNSARGHVWNCRAKDIEQAAEIEKKYHVSAKQYVNDGLQMKILAKEKPETECTPAETTLEDAYLYMGISRKD
mgnify:CR=1 FL=1